MCTKRNSEQVEISTNELIVQQQTIKFLYNSFSLLFVFIEKIQSIFTDQKLSSEN